MSKKEVYKTMFDATKKQMMGNLKYWSSFAFGTEKCPIRHRSIETCNKCKVCSIHEEYTGIHIKSPSEKTDKGGR